MSVSVHLERLGRIGQFELLDTDGGMSEDGNQDSDSFYIRQPHSFYRYRTPHTLFVEMIRLLVLDGSGPPSRLGSISSVVWELDLFLGLDDLDPVLGDQFTGRLLSGIEPGLVVLLDVAKGDRDGEEIRVGSGNSASQGGRIGRSRGSLEAFLVDLGPGFDNWFVVDQRRQVDIGTDKGRIGIEIGFLGIFILFLFLFILFAFFDIDKSFLFILGTSQIKFLKPLQVCPSSPCLFLDLQSEDIERGMVDDGRAGDWVSGVKVRLKKFGGVCLDITFGRDECDHVLGAIDECGFTQAFECQVLFGLVVSRTRGDVLVGGGSNRNARHC